jgi:hypothetical protein
MILGIVVMEKLVTIGLRLNKSKEEFLNEQ